MSESARRHLQIVLALCATISIAFTGYLFHGHRQMTQAVTQSTQELAAAETKEAARELGQVMASLVPTAQTLAADLSAKKLSKAQLEKRLHNKPVELHGLGVAFAPYRYTNNQELYAPYFLEQEGENKLINVADVYNYAEAQEEWFTKPMTEGAHFLEPYRGRASKATIAEYVVPFYDSSEDDKQTPAGVVFANQSVAHLNHILSTLYSGATGYWFILSKNGTFLAHPNPALAEERVNAFDLAQQQGNSALGNAAKKAVAGQTVLTQYQNELSGAPSYLFCEQIQTTGWVLCHVFDKNELPFEKDDLRRSLMQIVTSALLSLMLVILLALTYAYTKSFALWLAATTASTVLAIGLGLLWDIAHRYASYDEHIERVRGKLELYELAKNYEKAESIPLAITQENAPESVIQRLRAITNYYGTTKHVPTGIFLTDLQFINPSQIAIVGYVWQRYLDKTHGDMSRGFVLPQATSATIKEIYRKTQRGTETILWSVRAVINQQLSYRTYPFDTKRLEVEMWHKDFNQNVLLIPDLDSYRQLNPQSKPGLGEEAYLEGWQLTSSSFGYLKKHINALFGMYTRGLFGIYRQVARSNLPSLSFNMRAERRLAETLFSDLLPLMVIALLLFATFLASGEWGYPSLGSVASVFFGTVFAHMRFRDKIPPYEVVYFESFFFTMYAAILAIVILIVLDQVSTNLWLVQYRKNLIAKLLYWPSMLLTLVLITLYYLY